MSHEPDLKLRSLVLDGEQVVCPCGSTTTLFLERTGPLETWPARLGCYCGRAEDHQVITNGLLDAALEACTGRQSAGDSDTFAAEWRGITLAGERPPSLILDDLVVAGRALADEGRKHGRRWWRSTKRDAKTAARTRVDQARGKVGDAVGQAVGGAKAAVLSAAWQAQTGGAGPAPRPKLRRCKVKGCKRGWLTITSRLHSTTGKTQKLRVRCGSCHRA